MIIIYRAANSLDANMIKGLLEQYGIHAYIQGEYLQGGVGDLPAAGLITVSVDNEQQVEARKIVAVWETASIIEDSPNISLVGGALNASS